MIISKSMSPESLRLCAPIEFPIAISDIEGMNLKKLDMRWMRFIFLRVWLYLFIRVSTISFLPGRK